MDDWKLKARVVVKMKRKRDMFVSSYFRQWLDLRNPRARNPDCRSVSGVLVKIYAVGNRRQQQYSDVGLCHFAYIYCKNRTKVQTENFSIHKHLMTKNRQLY